VGGNVFKGSLSTSPILLDEVGPTLDEFFSSVLRHAGVGRYTIAGSAGVKPVSGDIDLVIGPFDVSSPATRRASKAALVWRLQSIVSDPSTVAVVGSNIAVSFPIAGRPDERVQIDLILSQRPEWTAWLMAGSPAGAKAAYRNLMLSYVARLRSNFTGVRVNLAWPGGVEVVEGGKVILARTEDPREILRSLGIRCSPSDVTTFEGLVTLLKGIPEVSSELEGYPAYIQSSLDDPRTSSEARRSVEILHSLLKESQS